MVLDFDVDVLGQPTEDEVLYPHKDNKVVMPLTKLNLNITGEDIIAPGISQCLPFGLTLSLDNVEQETGLESKLFWFSTILFTLHFMMIYGYIHESKKIEENENNAKFVSIVTAGMHSVWSCILFVL